MFMHLMNSAAIRMIMHLMHNAAIRMFMLLSSAPRSGCSCSPVQLQDLVAVEAGEILIRILAPSSHDDDLGGGTAAGLASEAAVVPLDIDGAQLVCSRDEKWSGSGKLLKKDHRHPLYTVRKV